MTDRHDVINLANYDRYDKSVEPLISASFDYKD